jgi:peptidoglycan/xylan/chitin deacetylase (PgdA/CDA1 family)
MQPLAQHGRYDYVPIRGRRPYSWPGGARLAIYVAVNLEHFAFGEGLGAELAPAGPQPDVLNYTWRDYGNRVGAWRLLDLFDELKLPVAVLPNAAICDYCPALVEAHRLRGDEIVGHGWSNSERQGVLDETDEARLIAEVTAKYSGTTPTGWLGPWISESRVTPDLLQEAGYRYLLDWCMDDQPVWMKTRQGRILSVPYPQELNDIPAIAARRMDAPDFADMIVDNFAEMRAQAASGPLVMGIALHPYLVGQPFRLLHLRRALRHIVAAGTDIWLTRPGAIAEHIASLPEGIVPGSVGA